MSNVKAHYGLRVPQQQIWSGEIVSHDERRIVIDDGVRRAVYEGSFKYTIYGEVFGRLDSYWQYQGNRLHFEITDIGVSAHRLYEAIMLHGDAEEFARVVLGKDDRLVGSSGNDVLPGLNGEDAVFGGTGDDKLSGGNVRDRLLGGVGDDFLRGDDQSDHLSGEAGNDRLEGGSGEDRLSGRGGHDRVNGDEGEDRLSGEAGDDALDGGSGDDRLLDDRGRDSLEGGPGEDFLSAGAGVDGLEGGVHDDRLHGGSGDDRLSGGPGADVLIGEGGADHCVGGSGADVFRYLAARDSPAAMRLRDTIDDFDPRADRIDLRAVDAAASTRGDDRFAFIGGDHFSGSEGELRYDPDSGVVAADIDGDGVADFAISLGSAPELDRFDFLL